MPTNRMKAISLVLIMLIGMIGFTGFGNTTADLTDNSTLETVVDSPEVSINVVYDATLKVAPVVSLRLSKTYSNPLEKVADVALIDQYRVELAKLAVPPDLKDFEPVTTLQYPSHLVNNRYSERSTNEDVGWRLAPADRLKFLCFS